MPPKRLSKALAGASSDEDYADLADPPFPPHGEAPSPRAKAKKAKKAPAATSSQPGSGDLVQDGWVSMHNDGVPFVMWKRYGEPAYSGKVAAFDLDGTLLLTTTTLKAGWGPANADDWRYFNASVPGKLAALVEEGFEICVLSNQGSVRSAHAGKAAAKVTARADAAIAALAPSVPVTVIYCTATKSDACAHRKPGPGMFDFYASVTRPPAAPPVDVSTSFFCGDAAGRGVGQNTANPAEPDFADSDSEFAAGVGLEFKTPEEVFGHAETPDEYSARAAAGNGDGAGVKGEGGGGAGVGGTGPNALLVSLFRQIADNSEGFRKNAVKKAAAILEGLDEAATDVKALKALKGIGKSSLAWIQEFMDTGDIAEAHAPKPPPAPAKEGTGALAFA